MTSKEQKYLQRYYLISALNEETEEAWKRSWISSLKQENDTRTWLLVVLALSVVPLLNYLGLEDFGEKYLR